MIKLISPNYVQRLADDNTYIIHGGNRELLEVDMKGDVVWKLLLPLLEIKSFTVETDIPIFNLF